MGPKGKPKEYMVPSSNNKNQKHGRFFRYFHGNRGSSSSSSDSSSNEVNARNGATKVQMEPVARLTIEDTELIEHYTDELLSEDLEPDYATPYHEEVPEPSIFTPKLYVKCGPLLRYVGLRLDSVNQIAAKRDHVPTAKEEREVWRGTVMMVTVDDRSSYNPAPRLRLFAQSIELLTGTREPAGRRDSASRLWRKKDGEKQQKSKDIVGTRLLHERGVTWWRFTIEIELTDKQARIAYRINRGPSIAFWVPARQETMNIMFHSCNGFSLGINPATFCGPDPMWRDALQAHRRKPFHVMIGGGDQVYNDAVAEQTTLFREWLLAKNLLHKYSAEWTDELSDELENFYLERYCGWFSQGLFGVANSQIPMVNIWDDHDIIDGFGSYPSHFNGCPVFSGLGRIAQKHYLLFQHHTRVYENESHEPSWIMGAEPGPYITERSRSIFMFMGRKVAFLGLDCRTERQRDVIVTPETYRLVFDRARREIVTGVTKHLIVLLGIPIAYPRLVWLENLLTSRLMDPLKALARMNVLGGVEILDDLDDHWTAKSHKAERNAFVKQLQHLAAEKSVRITVLGGDVHLSGIGQFYSNPQLGLPKERDHRYMPNVISSAIVNAPPPNAMADVLNKRNKVHHLDGYTDEDMYPMFPVDVDGKPRGNKRLMPRRNYCTLGEYDPNQDPEVEELSKASSRIGIPKFLRSSTQKKGTGLSGKSKQDIIARPQGANAVDALEVILRVEVNQKNPDGATKPYRLIIPPLTTQSYDATAST
ncbi:hypothetical protein BGX38DRAFT_1248916 [Terfezia claveryi]|nr:hypothetical protein BGX38DRAFT_1248916 [Terfezia claveryi]